MKKYRSFAFRAAAFAAALLYLTACGNEVEYPDGADSLPTYSATGTVMTVYDTSEHTTPEMTTASAQTTVSETTTVPDTETETQTETETVPSESETTISTSQSLSLEDVPEVGISEYYEKTQTTPPLPTTTSAPPQTTVLISDTSTVSESVSEDIVTAPSVSGELSVTSSAEAEAFTADVSGLNVKLTDGRKSEYTGREIISHPYSYYTLDEKHKKLYDKLVSAMLECDDKILFDSGEDISFEDLFDTYQLIYNDENRLFYISPTIEYVSDKSTGYIRSMKVNYTYSKENVQAMQAEIDKETDKILSMITPEMNDYDIVKLFHDYIIINCTYDSEAKNPNNIYGTLVEKEALCQGYSQSFTYLCSLAGIDSFIVLGVANEPHMWNVVKMDGDYYHVDLTWDDPDRAKSPDSVRYDYFGLTDDRIRELRQFDDYDYEIPEAKGTKYQYYYYNNLVAGSLSEARALIESEVLKAAETKASTIQILCADDDVFKEVTDVFFGNSQDNVIGILGSIKDKAKNRFNTESIYHNSNSSTRTVKIFLEYLD
ncbi:transglutaminase domain-containing protein [Huintestinicola sp.]|uniref:transglutaminase domain-containing protein n=1 Tax=Huintestinicola sp. TaxID=2981661 RepID=UPI003D7F0F4F